MEPWKLGVIGLLVAGIVGYGVLSNTSANPTIGGSNVAVGTGGSVLPVPTPSVYAGKTLPAWPSIKQWANTPGPVNLPALKGKPVLLEVFRTGCSHCQDAAPFVVELHKRYAARGVQFVAIQSPGMYTDVENPETKWPLVQSWIKERNYTWPVGFDDKSAWFQGKFGNKVTYPSLFLLDSTGKVAFFQSGHDIQKALELAIQLETIAPGSGNPQARANDLSRFLAPSLGMTDNTQKQLSSDLVPRLGGAPVAASPKEATMVSPALLLLSAPIGAGLWLRQRRTRQSN